MTELRCVSLAGQFDRAKTKQTFVNQRNPYVPIAVQKRTIVKVAGARATRMRARSQVQVMQVTEERRGPSVK